MSEYTFLYRGGRMDGSPEQMQRRIEKWNAWFKELSANGHVKAIGNPLDPAGKVVKGEKKSVTDGPFAEAKDVVGGYTIIEARDLDHAAELAKGCPVLEAGGSVEVRPIRKLNM